MSVFGRSGALILRTHTHASTQHSKTHDTPVAQHAPQRAVGKRDVLGAVEAVRLGLAAGEVEELEAAGVARLPRANLCLFCFCVVLFGEVKK